MKKGAKSVVGTKKYRTMGEKCWVRKDENSPLSSFRAHFQGEKTTKRGARWCFTRVCHHTLLARDKTWYKVGMETVEESKVRIYSKTCSAYCLFSFGSRYTSVETLHNLLTASVTTTFFCADMKSCVGAGGSSVITCSYYCIHCNTQNTIHTRIYNLLRRY